MAAASPRTSRQAADQSRVPREGDKEDHTDTFRELYRRLVDRLKADINYFLVALPEFVDAPKDAASAAEPQEQQQQQDPEQQQQQQQQEQQQSEQATLQEQVSFLRARDPAAFDVHASLRGIKAPEDDLTDLTPLVTLLNYRDGVLSTLLNGLLFQAAVLHTELGTKKHYPKDHPMAPLLERVASLVSKMGTVPTKLVEAPPGPGTPGPYTYDKSKVDDKGVIAATLSPLQVLLLSVLREVRSHDESFRNMKFGDKVSITEESRRGSVTKVVPASELRSEITKWHMRFIASEHELQNLKAQKHSSEKQQVEQLTSKISDKELQHRQQVLRAQKLEGELQSKVYENTSLKREKAELSEKNARMMKDSVPVLEKMDTLLDQAMEKVDCLNADAQLLSSMFQIQVQENQKYVDERDTVSRELANERANLKAMRIDRQLKEEELQKKEALHARTQAARQKVHEEYLEQRAQILDVEERYQQRAAERQQLVEVLQGREEELKLLQAQLGQASARIDELEQRKKSLLKDLRKATGRTCNALLEGYKAKAKAKSSVTSLHPTLSSSRASSARGPPSSDGPV
eukprot:TRINITY_DN17326_c0_g1_i1.p1 TRINITY_DN17326_c0_g1~~TRINITY_DN17326_c0_g1_i1.p1  ORF type:complete len:590 (+),score=180.85 TRINITY_DN17326_c0_g1_i1:49-1770(+)